MALIDIEPAVPGLLMKNLNTAQRFWMLGALAMLATTLVIIFMQWPLRDAAVMADLQAPECSQWREMAPERVYDAYPMTGDACFALRTLMVQERIVISSVSDYDEYRRATGVRRGVNSLLTWALIFGGIYITVWVTTWIVAKVTALRARKSE